MGKEAPQDDEFAWEKKLKKFDIPDEATYRKYLAPYMGYNPKVRMSYTRGKCQCKCWLEGRNEIGDSDVELKILLDAFSGSYLIRKTYKKGKREIEEVVDIIAGDGGKLVSSRIKEYDIDVVEWIDDRYGVGYGGNEQRHIKYKYDIPTARLNGINYGGRSEHAIMWDLMDIERNRAGQTTDYFTVSGETMDFGLEPIINLINYPINSEATLIKLLDLSQTEVVGAPPPFLGLTLAI